MGYVNCRDKRTGITYVYESQSYWDKEKQQPRAHRKLIGKIDEKTGEIIPTDGRGRHRKDQNAPKKKDTTLDEQESIQAKKRIRELELMVNQLQKENQELKKSRESILHALQKITEQYGQDQK